MMFLQYRLPILLDCQNNRSKDRLFQLAVRFFTSLFPDELTAPFAEKKRRTGKASLSVFPGVIPRKDFLQIGKVPIMNRPCLAGRVMAGVQVSRKVKIQCAEPVSTLHSAALPLSVTVQI